MQKHYDIGVVGFWYGSNYGSVLNGYATYKLLKKIGLKPLLIQKPGASSQDWELCGTHNAKFIEKNYPTDEISQFFSYDKMYELNELCDFFLVGSDQVWNEWLAKEFKYTNHLNFVNDNKPKISFASSFGQKKYSQNKEEIDRISRYLQRFDAISVRERSAVELCKKTFGVEAERVLEPVLCLTCQDYNCLANDSDFFEKEPYILSYILDPTPQKRELITYYSERLELKAINILNGVETLWEKNNKALNLPNTLFKPNASDYIKAISGASYIITDSFHGTAFSILYNKPFVSIANQKRGLTRFQELLEIFGLDERLLINMDKYKDEKYFATINYIEINEIIENEAKKTYAWLEKAIIAARKKLLDKCVVTKVGKDSCISCTSCVLSCPSKALFMKTNREGFQNPEIEIDKCTNCGKCLNICPVSNPQYNNEGNPECYAVCANDDIRFISSSGGAFSLAANHIIEQGGYVVGAAFTEDYHVEHIIVNQKEDLNKLRGSKYYQSDLGNTFEQVKGLLDEKQLILFTGLPCQIAGLYAFLGRDYDNLYTIDLVCHGISSYKVFEKYHKDVHGQKKIKELKFKAKEPWGWHPGVNLWFEDGTHYAEPAERDSFYISYLKSISKNKACGTCKFNKIPRQADITIGDFWGIDKFNKALNDGKGTSEVLINNQRGQILFAEIRKQAKVVEVVPVEYAINGNTVMRKPYALHKNRGIFFERIKFEDFAKLTDQCVKDNFNIEQKQNVDLSTLDLSRRGLYYLAKMVHDNYRNRKIVLWGDGPIFRSVLKKYFDLEPSFVVTTISDKVSKNVKLFEILNGKSNEYYLVCIGKKWEQNDENKINNFGYEYLKDYVYRIPKPIVLENYDMNGENYIDVYGNQIIGSTGKIGKVIFRGLGNEIKIGTNVKGTEKITFDLAANCAVRIEDGTVFSKNSSIELLGEQGICTASLFIGKRCFFEDTLFRLYTDIHTSRIIINDHSTFGEKICMHANQGKQIVVGSDCMFSRNIDIWAGDGHTIFDVVSQKNTNCDYETLPFSKKQVYIGDHVWVGKNAFILAGAEIGTGSIVGARSTVKGFFPNNCVIAGNPAIISKRNAAWSRDMVSNKLSRCGSPYYVGKTSDSANEISGRNVLVIGGTKIMGTALVNRLIALGNNVTVLNRGKSKDYFEDRVKRIHADVTDSNAMKNALTGKNFDVVFDNLAFCSNNVRNVLSNVECCRYIQLSSVETYYPAKGWIREEKFDPNSFKHEWYGWGGNYDYVYGKRQAEITVFQIYKNISAVTIRIPYVIPTDRIYYYAKNVIKGQPMAINNINRGLAFIRGEEVGRFLPWIAAQDYTGPINLASKGFVTIEEIFDYILKRTGKEPIIDLDKGIPEPFNVYKEKTFSMDMTKAESLGWISSDINDWFWAYLDKCIDQAMKENKYNK